jgi:hypothetical protein
MGMVTAPVFADSQQIKVQNKQNNQVLEQPFAT